MIQRGQGPGFALEPLQSIRVGGKGFGKDLDGDLSVQARVSTPEDLPHTARPQRTENLEMANALCRHGLVERMGACVRLALPIVPALGAGERVSRPQVTVSTGAMLRHPENTPTAAAEPMAPIRRRERGTRR